MIKHLIRILSKASARRTKHDRNTSIDVHREENATTARSRYTVRFVYVDIFCPLSHYLDYSIKTCRQCEMILVPCQDEIASMAYSIFDQVSPTPNDVSSIRNNHISMSIRDCVCQRTSTNYIVHWGLSISMCVLNMSQYIVWSAFLEYCPWIISPITCFHSSHHDMDASLWTVREALAESW